MLTSWLKKKKKTAVEASQVSTFFYEYLPNHTQGWDQPSLVIRIEEDMGTEMGYRAPKWTLECKHQGVSQVTSWRLISSLCAKNRSCKQGLGRKKAPESPFKVHSSICNTNPSPEPSRAQGNLTVREGSAMSNLQSGKGLEQEPDERKSSL